jgi:hypothetical protein
VLDKQFKVYGLPAEFAEGLSENSGRSVYNYPRQAWAKVVKPNYVPQYEVSEDFEDHNKIYGTNVVKDMQMGPTDPNDVIPIGFDVPGQLWPDYSDCNNPAWAQSLDLDRKAWSVKSGIIDEDLEESRRGLHQSTPSGLM